MTPAEKALAFLERHNMWLRILLKADDRDPRSRDALRELQELFPEAQPVIRSVCLTCKGAGFLSHMACSACRGMGVT